MTTRRSGSQPADAVLDAVREVVAQRDGVPVRAVQVSDVRRLSGGASRLTWEVVTDPGAAVIIQQERPGSAGLNLAMQAQVELLRDAAHHGVAVPPVLGEGSDGDAGYVVLGKVPGESLAARIRNHLDQPGGGAELARRIGAACARVHAMDPASHAGLGQPEPLETMRALLDGLGEPHPAFELGLAHLQRTRPAARPTVVVHGDFRMGNLLVERDRLTAVLDWELAHLGSAVEDLGWFCARAWRFGSPLRAGGIAGVEDLLEGYASAGGDPPGAAELDWWEAYACLRWGLICVLQASVHLRGLHRSAELAAIGRRAAECEEDLLELVAGPSNLEPPPLPAARREPPHDAPGAGELAEAVAESLDSAMGRSEGAAGFDLRVARNVVRIVGREIAYGSELVDRHRARLEALGFSDDASLARAIRHGALDEHLDEVCAAVRGAVRDKLAVSNPGYWNGDAPDDDTSGDEPGAAADVNGQR